MPNFTGQLKTNEVIGALFNQIISIQTFADNIATDVHGSFYESMKVDGSKYGDTKLFISTDIPEVKDWLNDAESDNLLKLYRPEDPKTQAITIDTFKYVPITIDNYMSARAFSEEGSLSQFNTVVKSWLTNAKKVFMTKYFNVKAGTETSTNGKQSITVSPSSAQTLAQAVGLAVANLMIDLKDATRDYNDNSAMRSYDYEDIKILWNAEYLNKITKLDLPVIFNNTGIVEKLGQYVIPSRYFGTAQSATTNGDGATVRFINGGKVDNKYYFPGELVPSGKASGAANAYKTNAKVICKITTRGALPIMQGFEVTTNFFNEASLTETTRLIWGFNTVEHIKDKPYITLIEG